MAVKVYDPADVDLLIADIPIAGFADGEMITLEFTSQAFTSMAGSDGEVARSKSNDRRAVCTVKLLQTSDSNDLLSALYASDQLASNGAGIGAFLLRDGQGRSLYTAAECWIQKHPNVSFDREPTPREWVIEIADCQAFTGGN